MGYCSESGGIQEKAANVIPSSGVLGIIKCVASGKLDHFYSCGANFEKTQQIFMKKKMEKICIILPESHQNSVCVRRLRGGGMVSPQPVTTLGRRWRPGREGRGSAWAGRVPGRWFSKRTPRVSASRYATSSFTLQSPPYTQTSRWESSFKVLNYIKYIQFWVFFNFCVFAHQILSISH